MQRAVALVYTRTKRAVALVYNRTKKARARNISTDFVGDGRFGHSSRDIIQMLFFAAEF